MSQTARDGSMRPSLGLLAASALGAALVLLPIGLTAMRAAQVGGAQAWRLLFRPLVGALLINTASLAAVSVVLAAILGTATLMPEISAAAPLLPTVSIRYAAR